MSIIRRIGPLKRAVAVRNIVTTRTLKCYSSGNILCDYHRNVNYFCNRLGPCYIYSRHNSSVKLVGHSKLDRLDKLDNYPAVLGIRSFHSTNSVWDDEPSRPSSKVETTVKALEKELEKSKDTPPEKRPLYKRIQDEILHYYHGFRLLLVDTKICLELIWRILNGKVLSRREYKQLIRTTSDLFRLVPFSVFIIVPFMELLLPVFLKFFPGMLPSTFQSNQDRESKMKGQLKVKLEMAKFLQQTLDSMAPQASGRSSQQAKEFSEFIEKIRKSGSEAATEEIMKYVKLFEDEITLDSLSRQQLMALCRVIEIPALGTSAMLRFHLRLRLRSLIADDKVIENEGVDALDLQELQNACKARGMRAIGMPEDRLRRQLRQWLTLSLHEKVPQSLLLLTRTMYLPENLPPIQQLQATLQALPDATTLQTKAAIGEREGKIDNKTRIELIKEEERKIREERQEAKIQAQLKEEKEMARREIEGEDPPRILFDPENPPAPYKPDEEDFSVQGTINNVMFRKYPESPAFDDSITPDDFDEIEHVIAKIGKDTKLVIEKEEIRDLKAEISDYVEDVQELEAISERTSDMKLRVRESKGARRLLNKLNTMIQKLDETVTSVDAEEKEKKAFFQKSLVATSELMSAVRKAKDVKDPAKLERIAAVFSKLDDDSDGKIEVDDLVKVIDVVGREHVDLSSKQLEELVGMLAKEELLEELGKSLERTQAAAAAAAGQVK